MNGSQITAKVLKPLVFLACLVPAGTLVWGILAGSLGANPVETITHLTGEWGLRLLLVTLAITPVRRLTPWQSAIRLRRMLGLFSFFYVAIHFTTFVWLDHSFILADILEDIIERPYITVGFIGLLALMPLAATSTNAMIKRLGGRRWIRLHRIVYIAAFAAVIHFLWLVKADLREPLIYLAVLCILMLFRLPSVLERLQSLRKHASRGASSRMSNNVPSSH